MHKLLPHSIYDINIEIPCNEYEYCEKCFRKCGIYFINVHAIYDTYNGYRIISTERTKDGSSYVSKKTTDEMNLGRLEKRVQDYIEDNILKTHNNPISEIIKRLEDYLEVNIEQQYWYDEESVPGIMIEDSKGKEILSFCGEISDYDNPDDLLIDIIFHLLPNN